LLIAPRLEVAHVYLSRASVSVILYDQDLPGISWRTGAQSLLHHSDPACLILLSFVADDRLRRSVLHIGGYDVAEKPLRRSNLVPLVNGYCLLRKNIDSL
jgi:DNA-binding response OmpR family regulator